MKTPFVPMNLPLRFNDGELGNVIEDTFFHKELLRYTEAISKFKVISHKTKLNPTLIYSGLLFNEAIFSTRIEGTQATITDVYEYEISKSTSNSKDIQEVMNYYNAIKDGEKLVNQYALSSRLFTSLHQSLMSGSVRGKNLSPGEYRRIQNYIGPKGCNMQTASFVPPSPELIDSSLSNLENYINYDETNHPIIRTAIFHAQFETIHPFLDGNGRLGRVLIPITLYYFKQIDTPNFFVSESLERNKYRYYELLNGTRKNTIKGWQEWISFFIESVTEQTIKDSGRIEKIDALYEKVLSQSRKIKDTVTMMDLVSLMFEKPILTAKVVSERLELNANTARTYLSLLNEHRILSSNDAQRNVTFYFYDLLNLL